MDIDYIMSIADKLQDLVTAKEDMKSALVEKGVTPTGGLSTYADALHRLYPGDFNGIKFSGSEFTQGPLFETSILTTMNNMFSSCKSMVSIPELNTSNVTDMGHMFYECNSLTSIPQMDTSNVTNMVSMFDHCSSLTTIPQMDTSNVTNMNRMFQSCYSLTSIPSLDTSNVTNMNRMFFLCGSLSTIPQLDTSKVTDMNSMFCYCSSLTSIPQMDTSNVTDMSSMFDFSYNLTSIPMLDCSSVTNMKDVFGVGGSSDYQWEITDLGGFKNVGATESFGELRILPLHKLTHESLMNVIDNLYNRDTMGFKDAYLFLASEHYTKLTDEEIAIGTNKGWIVC